MDSPRPTDSGSVFAGITHTPPTTLLIGGTWRESEDASTFNVEDPATGGILAHVADASVNDGMAALDAAVDAQASWAALPPRTRSNILREAFEQITSSTDDLAQVITLEMGKPLQQAHAEVEYAAELFRWFSEESVRVFGRWSTAPNGASRLLTMKQPVGPTLMVTPWNFPLSMAARKVAPAIASGCTMVIKPSSTTPLTTLALAHLLTNCGVPPGVLNVVPTRHTKEMTAGLMHDSRLRKLTFTGSTSVGRLLARQATENMLRVSMELGGNAPFIVFQDADVDKAVECALIAKMRNMGEACTAANRILVQESILDPFASRFAERMSQLRVGCGTDDVDVGPLIDGETREQMVTMVGDALDRGASLLCGGNPIGGPGYFFEPTVLAGVPWNARVMQEEIFGPIAPISTFTSEAEALNRANDTEYGLVAYVFTRDLDRAIRVAEALEFGMVGVNQGLISNAAAPFGGVKSSGVGREGGPEGIEEFLETKYVGIARE